MNIDEIKAGLKEDIKKVIFERDLNDFKSKYTGKKGAITGLFASMKAITDPSEKKEKGKIINELKQLAESIVGDKEKEFIDKKRKERLKDMDVTLPAYRVEKGSEHLLVKAMDEINSIFMRMGFTIEQGPEIETEYNNFRALNFPSDHPAMDMHDTFYMDDTYLLRTHTSPIQIRAMLKHKPPLKIIAPGRVYRRDAPDASHSPVFHQVEGFMVDTDIKFSDLKGLLAMFLNEVFGTGLKTRFRPSFFPFTEPSAEVDVECANCRGKGCPTCKQTGWLEILGAGMIHPNVFKSVNYDSEKYRGFAFGMGVERIAMLKYNVTDMRLFFENDTRFLKQF